MSRPFEKTRPVARLGAHEGRLAGDYAEDALRYFYWPRVEGTKHLFVPVMKYNKAHVVMLTEQEILDAERAKKLLVGLQDVEQLGIEGIELDPRLQGIYPITEALVIDRVGYNVGGMLYLGRARGDAQKVPDRMFQRDAVLDIMSEVAGIQAATLGLSAQHVDTLMPGYTHLQHAQPMTFGFYLLWFADAMEADFQRLMNVYERLNMSSAEVGAGMTTSFPVDRDRVAELLGFEGLIDNALFAHRSMDREVETLSTLSILALDMYRLAEDFLIWCASDVGFMELDDQHSATSFMMAQKKNPMSLYHAETAAIVARSATVAIYDIAMRNTSEMALWANRATQTVHEALETVTGSARLLKAMLPSVVLHTDRMADSVGRRFAQGTDLADALVREAGLSFREAHRVIGTLVRHALEQSMVPDDITLDLLGKASEEAIGRPVVISATTLKSVLDPAEGVRAKKVFGGPAPESVRDAIERKRVKLEEHTRWLASKRSLLKEADRKLAAACAAILMKK